MIKRMLFIFFLVSFMAPSILFAESSESVEQLSNDQINYNNSEIKLRVPQNNYKDKKFDLLIESDFFSEYVSKGLPCSKGPVWQPSITAEYYNIGVSLWANFVLNDEPNQGQFNEIDIIPFYDLEIGKFTFIPAVDFMFGLNTDPASLNYMNHNVIRPQFHMAYQLGHFTPYTDFFLYVYPQNRFGLYTDFGANFNYVFTDFFQLDTSAQFAVGGKRWNSPRIADVGTKLNNFEYVMSLTFTVYKSFSIAPVMHIIITIPEQLRNSLDEPDFVWGGLILKYDI